MEQTILSGDERREKLLALLLLSDEPLSGEKSGTSIMSAVRLSYRISHCSVQKGIQSYRRHVAICMKKMLATKIAGGL